MYNTDYTAQLGYINNDRYSRVEAVSAPEPYTKEDLLVTLNALNIDRLKEYAINYPQFYKGLTDAKLGYGVMFNPDIVNYAENKLLFLQFIGLQPKLLASIPRNYKQTLAIVRQNGKAIQYVTPELRDVNEAKGYKLWHVAIRNEPKVITYLANPPKDLVDLAVSLDFSLISQYTEVSESVILHSLRRKQNVIHIVPLTALHSKAVLHAMVAADPDCLTTYTTLTPSLLIKVLKYKVPSVGTLDPQPSLRELLKMVKRKAEILSVDYIQLNQDLVRELLTTNIRLLPFIPSSFRTREYIQRYLELKPNAASHFLDTSDSIAVKHYYLNCYNFTNTNAPSVSINLAMELVVARPALLGVFIETIREFTIDRLPYSTVLCGLLAKPSLLQILVPKLTELYPGLVEECIKQNSEAIRYIPNPTPILLQYAIACHPQSIKYITNPTTQLILQALTRDLAVYSRISGLKNKNKLTAGEFLTKITQSTDTTLEL